MFLMTMISMITLLLTTIIMFIASLLSQKNNKDREKNSPFECGFDPKESARLPFSLRFFLIAVIFLIFDVEITLLLPVIFILPYSKLSTWISTTLIFLIILLMGLYFEWNQGVLNWSN
uniref:NADH-ubiquinone oxidoreductase chain 3 n=1 Tax=Spongiocaris panglao TaxID=1986577 RepID=A0A345F0M5_9EUCA|nr:NADH dehydrogenase subunit 3 [Spongiocaris panglao]AXG21500.1 NADH dehydrogenase subunit 3 [Spongiocaris panglao]